MYAGAEDAALYVSHDGGRKWQELTALRQHTTGPRGSPAPAACACTRSSWTRCNKDRIYVAISAAGAFRSDDAGASWLPINKGLRSGEIPDTDAEVGHCVHHITQHPARPDTLFMQKHWDVMRTDDAGANWREISGDLPSDFGFPIAVHAHEPETIYVVPIKSDSEHFPPEGKLRVYRSRTGGDDWEPLTKGLPQSRLLRQHLPRRDGGRHARPVRRLLRYHRWPGLPLGRRRRHAGRRSSGTCRRCSRWKSRCCRDPGRSLPAHLKNLAHVSGEVPRCPTRSTGPVVTQRVVLDALEARYPMLLGTIRDRHSGQAAGLRALLRLRGGPVQRVAGHPAARAGRRRRGALHHPRRDGRRITSGEGGVRSRSPGWT